MRVKGGVKTRKRHKKVMKAAKGYRGGRKCIYKIAHQAVMRAWQYMYRHRKERKREMRRLWIIRIGAAVKEEGLNYSKFIYALKKGGIEIDRKILAHLAMEEPETFKGIVAKAKQILASP